MKIEEELRGLLKGRSLMVAEDEDRIRDLMQLQLRKVCDEVYSAADGEEAVAIYHEHRPDIILLDLKMPGFDGNEVIEKIRHADQDTIVIVVTAHADLDTHLHAVDGVIIKPAEFHDILKIMRRALIEENRKKMAESENRFRVLVYFKKEYFQGKLTSALENENVEFVIAKNPQQARRFLDKYTIHFIYIEILEQEELDFISEIKKNPLTRDIPLSVLAPSDSTQQREQLYKIGISDYFVEPFFKSDVLNRFKSLVSREGGFKSSMTTRQIDAVVGLLHCEMLALRMESVAKMMGHFMKMDIIESMDVSRVCKLMSIAIEKCDAKEAIEYMRILYIAKPLLDIMTTKGEKMTSALMWRVVDMERQLLGKAPYHPEISLDSEGEKHLEELYQNDFLMVDSFDDIRYAQILVEGMIPHVSKKKENTEAFVQELRTVLVHNVTFHNGCDMTASQVAEKIEVTIKPHDHQIKAHCLKVMGIETVIGKQRQLECRKSEKSGYPEYILTLGMIEEKVPEVVQEVITPQVISAPHEVEPTKSAMEYLHENPLEADEEELFRDIENEMLEILDNAHRLSNLQLIVTQLQSLILKYANALIYHNEFSNIAEALLGLGRMVENTADLEIDEKQGQQIIFVLDSIISNLKKWRHSIFVEQDAADIHYLDNSIVADCDQFLMMLFPPEDSEYDDEDDGLELF